MFGKKKRMDTAAVGAPPEIQPGPTTIHNYSTNWPGIVAIGFLCALSMLPILWWMLVFLLDRMGARDPEREAAWWLVAIPLVSVGLLWIRWLADSLLVRVLDYKRDAIAMRLELERTKLLTAQSDTDGMRMNSEDRPFAKLIIAVMYEAFRDGPKGTNGEIRWSRRQAKAISDTHGLGLSEARCGALGPWLRQYGVITKENKISARYKSLGEVKRLVSDVFNVPVTVGDDIGMSGQHLYGEDGDSWG